MPLVERSHEPSNLQPEAAAFRHYIETFHPDLTLIAISKRPL
jgi:hypothetical protein